MRKGEKKTHQTCLPGFLVRWVYCGEIYIDFDIFFVTCDQQASPTLAARF